MTIVKSIAASALFLSASLGLAAPAIAAEKYLAEVFISSANFCPRGTMEANGQLLAISQYTAVFSLMGTMYGGDGRTSFALPDMRPTNADGEREPFETLRYCVVTQGIFPSRS